jgi:lysophospholipase L1-like esterase
MRILLAFLVLVSAGVAIAAVARSGDERGATRDTGAVTLVGDSLNVGIEPYLDGELRGWTIDAHDRVGRATDEGVTVLRERRRALAPVVVVSLGTNDADGSEAQFAALVEESTRVVGSGRCLVWATVVRDGEPRTGFNQVLERARSVNSNLRLVDWAALVGEEPGLLAADRVHGTPDGYARRAADTARAVRSCPTRSGT